MLCPKCQTKMESGTVQITHGLFGLPYLGLFGPNLAFTSPEESQTLVLSYWTNNEAFGCKKCSSVFVTGRVTAEPGTLNHEQEAAVSMFNEATRLDQAGEWDRAIALFEQIADKLPGQQDGDYARNCANAIRKKKARAEGA